MILNTIDGQGIRIFDLNEFKFYEINKDLKVEEF